MSFEPSSYASAAPSPGPSSGGLAAVAASEEGGDADYFGRVLREREQRAKEEAEQKKEFATKGAHRTEFHELHKQLKYCNTTTRELDEVIVANCRIRSGTIETDLDVAEEPEGIKQTFIHLLKGKGRAASGAKSVSSSASKSIDTSKWRKMQGLRRSTNSEEGGVEMSSRHPSSASDVTTTTIQRRPKSVSLVDARLRLAVGFINDAKAGRGARLHRRNVRAMAAYHLHNSIGVRVVVMVVALLQMMVTPWEPLSIRQASLPLSKQIQDNDVGYWWTTAVDIVACVVYILFLLLKFYHLGMWQFWRKGWNRFYFGLVILSTIDLLLKPVAVIPPISMPLRPFMVVCLSQKLRHAVIVFGRTLIAKGTLNVMLQIGILIIVFSVFGVYWMAGNASWWEGDGVCSFCNFNDTLNSMLSFYVLSTSENYPDVMVPALTRAYEERGVFDFPVFLFLIAFIFVYQIFLLNVVIAVFVDVYNSQRRQQIVAQRVRERKGLLAAFRALDHDSTGFLSYDTYSRLIRRLLPKLTPGQIRMTFDVMDVDGNNQIDVMEFFELLDVMVLRFRKPMVEKVRRIEDEGVVSRNIMRVREALHSIVHTNKSKVVFGVFSALLTIASIVVLYGIADQGLALQLTGGSTNNSPSSPPLPPSLEAFVWASFFISLLMVAEIGVRMLAVKPQRFWSSMWDVFDTVLVFISFLAEIIGLAVDPVGNGVINAVRALRVLRLITISDRSKLFARVFLDTAVSLVPYIYLALASGFVFVVVGSFIFEPLEYDIRMNQTYYASSGAVVNITATSGSFQTFSTSSLLLFQMLTQSNWFEPMYIYMERVNIWAPDAWPIASVYFVTFNFLMVLLLMNLISALVIKIFQAKQELEMESKDILVEAVSKRKTRWSVSSPTGSRPSIAAQRPSEDLHLPPSGGDPRPAERRSLREEEGLIERAASYRESAGRDGSDVFVMERKKRLSTEMFQKEMIGKDELGQAVLDEDRKEKGTKKGGVDRSIDAALHKQRQAAEKAHSVRAEKGEKNRTAKRRITDIINDLSVLPNPTSVPKLPKSTGEVDRK